MTTQNILTIPDKRFDPHLLLPAVDILKAHGVVAYPTETVYGLGASMLSKSAVTRIHDIKHRQKNHPISLMVDSIQMALNLTNHVSIQARALMNAYWPGPLTLVLAASANVPAYLRSVDNKIGIRFPAHGLSTALVRLLGVAVTSTSANRTGMPPACSAAEVTATLDDDVDLIIDAGPNPAQAPSTVIDISGERARLLRAGAISFEHIQIKLREFANAK